MNGRMEMKDNNNRKMKREWKWTNGIEGKGGKREGQTERKKGKKQMLRNQKKKKTNNQNDKKQIQGL